MKLRALADMPEWFLAQINAEIETFGFSSWIIYGTPPEEAGEAPKTVLGVTVGAFNARVVRADPGGIPEEWSYPHAIYAIQAFIDWEDFAAGPDGWTRNVSLRGIFRRDEQGIYRDGER